MINSVIEQSDLDYLNSNEVYCMYDYEPIVVGTFLNSNNNQIRINPNSGYAITSAKLIYLVEEMDKWGDTVNVEYEQVLTEHSRGYFYGNSEQSNYSSFLIETAEQGTGIGYQITQNDLDNFSAKNVEFFIDGVLAVVGDYLSDSETNLELRFKALNGYAIVEAQCEYNGTDKWGDPTIVEKFFTLELDSTEAFLVAYDEYLNIQVTTSEQPTEIKPPVNIYVSDSETFKSAFDSAFIIKGEEQISQLPSVMGYKNYPFNIPEYLLGDSSDIIIGQRNTEIQSVTLNDSYIKVDLGIISIPSDNDVIATNKKMVIYPPYLDPIELTDLSRVLGYDLTFELSVELLSGECIFTVYSSKDDLEVLNSKGNLGIEYPYKTGDYVPYKQTSLNYNVTNDNNVVKVLILDFNNNELNNSPLTIPVKVSESLGNTVGYVRVDDIILNLKITNDERDMIETQLRNGVFINE